MTKQEKMKDTKPDSVGVGTLRRLVGNLVPAVVFAVIVVGARSTLADHYIVPSGSMEPTVHVGDRLVVNKLAYGLRIPMTTTYVWKLGEPAGGDVAVLESPHDGKVLLKRVVGTPGDLIEVRNGTVTLNGEPQLAFDDEGVALEVLGNPHQLRMEYGGGPDYGPAVIPEGKYLVMGDNRGESLDGRMFGLVEEDAILGRAVGVYFSGGGPQWRPL